MRIEIRADDEVMNTYIWKNRGEDRNGAGIRFRL